MGEKGDKKTRRMRKEAKRHSKLHAHDGDAFFFIEYALAITIHGLIFHPLAGPHGRRKHLLSKVTSSVEQAGEYGALPKTSGGRQTPD